MKTFFEKYIDELETIYKMKYKKDTLDDNDKNKIMKYFNEKIKNKYKPTSISVSNTAIQESDEKPIIRDMISLYDRCRKNGDIFSLSHGVFNNKKSQIIEIWDEQRVRRNDFKNKMKEAMRANNTVEANKYNGFQKVFKENANALYGIFGESNFTFYDLNNISNITGCCVQVLLTTINELEKVLGNRVILRNDQEVMDYLSYLLTKDIEPYYKLKEKKFELLELLENKVSDETLIKEYIYNKLASYMLYEASDFILDKIKDTLDFVFKSNNIARKIIFTYNCNFEKLMEDTDIFRKMILNDFDNFISSKDYSEKDFVIKNEDYKLLLELAVFDNYLQANLLDIADNYKRKVVKLSDTDSTFCHAPLIFNNIMKCIEEECDKKGIKFDSELDYKVHTFKLIMFLGEHISNYFLEKLAGVDYQDSKDNRWKLKSEFLYNKILIMKVKKTYIGSILSQEGIRLTPMKLDNKNTELVRSRYNFITKEFLTDFYEELILNNNDKINIGSLMEIRDDYRLKFKSICNDYKKCSRLGTRADYKVVAAYKNNPFTVYQYKAAVTFNSLFPEYRTLPGDKTTLLPIKSMTKLDFKLEIDKKEIYTRLNLLDNQFELLDKKIKSDNVDIGKVEDIINKEKLNLCVTESYINDIREYYNNEKNKLVKEWYIENYGINEELRNRFSNLFNRKEKTKLEKELIENLLRDESINYLAFSYYGNMPECMLGLIDTDRLLLDSIDERLVRIMEALDIKVYSSNGYSFITNIISV